MEEYRRTIDELCTLYKYEPTVREVYVESSTDVRVVDVFLSNHDLSASIKTIDFVNMPAKTLMETGNDNGNRGRILALATLLELRLEGAARRCPTLIYDRDWEWDTPRSSDILIPTDYSCIEMHLFDLQVFRKLLRFTCQSAELSPALVLASLQQVLIRLWLIKYTNHSGRFNLRWQSFHKFCTVKDQKIKFDEERFIEHYLAQNNSCDKKSIFLRQLAEASATISSEPKLHINGHHFVTLAWLYLKVIARDKSAIRSEEGFERVLWSCCEVSLLQHRPMFIQLRDRVSA